MAKIIGQASLKQYCRNLKLTTPILARDLAGLIEMPEDLAKATIMVRDHKMLEDDEFIDDDDEIFLFIAVMGG